MFKVVLNIIEHFTWTEWVFRNTEFFLYVIYLFFILYLMYSLNIFYGIKNFLKNTVCGLFFKQIFGVLINTKFTRFAPFCGSIFMLILLTNIFALFCWSYTITAVFFFTSAFTCTFFFFGVIYIWLCYGRKSFNMLLPTHIPGFLGKFLIFIEFITFFVKVFTLNLRLFLNIMIGHLLLNMVCSVLFYQFLLLLQFGFFIFSIIALLFLVIGMFCLEVLVAALQTYIFFFLLNIYFLISIK